MICDIWSIISVLCNNLSSQEMQQNRDVAPASGPLPPTFTCKFCGRGCLVLAVSSVFFNSSELSSNGGLEQSSFPYFHEPLWLILLVLVSKAQSGTQKIHASVP